MTRYAIETYSTTGFGPDGKELKTWKRLMGKENKPASWDTRAKAEQMLKVCFGSNPTTARIIEVNDEAAK